MGKTAQTDCRETQVRQDHQDPQERKELKVTLEKEVSKVKLGCLVMLGQQVLMEMLDPKESQVQLVSRELKERGAEMASRVFQVKLVNQELLERLALKANLGSKENPGHQDLKEAQGHVAKTDYPELLVTLAPKAKMALKETLVK